MRQNTLIVYMLPAKYIYAPGKGAAIRNHVIEKKGSCYTFEAVGRICLRQQAYEEELQQLWEKNSSKQRKANKDFRQNVEYMKLQKKFKNQTSNDHRPFQGVQVLS